MLRRPIASGTARCRPPASPPPAALSPSASRASAKPWRKNGLPGVLPDGIGEARRGIGRAAEPQQRHPEQRLRRRIGRLKDHSLRRIRRGTGGIVRLQPQLRPQRAQGGLPGSAATAASSSPARRPAPVAYREADRQAGQLRAAGAIRRIAASRGRAAPVRPASISAATRRVRASGSARFAARPCGLLLSQLRGRRLADDEAPCLHREAHQVGVVVCCSWPNWRLPRGSAGQTSRRTRALSW